MSESTNLEVLAERLMLIIGETVRVNTPTGYVAGKLDTVERDYGNLVAVLGASGRRVVIDGDTGVHVFRANRSATAWVSVNPSK